jgi:hypothetical protein
MGETPLGRRHFWPIYAAAEREIFLPEPPKLTQSTWTTIPIPNKIVSENGLATF